LRSSCARSRPVALGSRGVTPRGSTGSKSAESRLSHRRSVRAALRPFDRLGERLLPGQGPRSSSFVSASGPSTTVRFLPENFTAPFELGCGPSRPSSHRP
jgi:hypothetical protein